MIKLKPEDFIVKEIFSPKLSEKGDYVYFELTKKNYNTLDAIKKIAYAVKIEQKKFGFAGSKDRNAVTTQIISVKTANDDKIRQLASLSMNDIIIKVIGRAEKPISLGDHEGNEFTITIRNMDKTPSEINQKFINYFGEQRFGKNNAEVGKLIIKREWKKAAELIGKKDVNEHLQKYPTDFIGAIKKLPNKLVSMYIHAYQSGIWNKVAEKVGCDEFSTPGFGMETADAKAGKLTQELLDKDGISERDFIVREIPNMHTEGRTRKRLAEARNLKIIEEGSDELNKGKKKIIINFSLGKGVYATEFLKQAFK